MEIVQIEYRSPNTTSLIQPMDQGFVHAFKALYTRNALQHLVEAEDRDFVPKAYWREYTIASSLLNIQSAIQEMKSETLDACWKKTVTRSGPIIRDALLMISITLRWIQM
uniref:DDE-1 domain-containing protein n=1 Tax=Fundulus heteroclitus TaxID=8078 RepID=A0A3Q2PJ54_FUNHE